MASLPIPTNPRWPSHRTAITLEGVRYRFRFVWRPRLRGWYVAMFKADGTRLTGLRRLSPGWLPFAGLSIEDGPPGVFVVRGSDGYDRLDLGRSLEFIYVESADIDAQIAARTTEEDFTITLL